ncbi:hypothetical protein NDN08_002594 [Rhodosorus marinus]|uniref:Mediator of RNA polymerase II transcription subunit 7 n=1 Tax=Rhodosorus marinus TaxID=101924 RepID=A0AAV8UU60_9RHOD|nr:hypothetical protein NDN08_002594 [Rhodosorus marinus]
MPGSEKRSEEVSGVNIEGEARAKKRRRYSEAQDLSLLRCILEVRAHLAPYGEKMKRFATTADRLNESELFPWHVDAKNCLERFNLLIELHKRNDVKSDALRPKEATSREQLLDSIVEQMNRVKGVKELETGGASGMDADIKAEARDLKIRGHASKPRNSSNESSGSSQGSKEFARSKYIEDKLVRRVLEHLVEYQFGRGSEREPYRNLAATLERHEEILSQQSTILDRQTATLSQLVDLLKSMREENREHRELVQQMSK